MSQPLVMPTEAIEGAARAAASAGDQAGAIDLSGPAEAMGTALPGSTSAQAASELGQSWRRGMAGWTADMSRHSEELRAASREMRGVDEAGAGAIARPLSEIGRALEGGN